MKSKFEEDAKRSRLVQVAKHDEALNMITQLRKENESLKEELKSHKSSGMK
jgi:mRNA-degrading endonuclease YafQ of YafQ-DinJ toxin-antitoxin module